MATKISHPLIKQMQEIQRITGRTPQGLVNAGRIGLLLGAVEGSRVDVNVGNQPINIPNPAISNSDTQTQRQQTAQEQARQEHLLPIFRRPVRQNPNEEGKEEDPVEGYEEEKKEPPSPLPTISSITLEEISQLGDSLDLNDTIQEAVNEASEIIRKDNSSRPNYIPNSGGGSGDPDPNGDPNPNQNGQLNEDGRRPVQIGYDLLNNLDKVSKGLLYGKAIYDVIMSLINPPPPQDPKDQKDPNKYNPDPKSIQKLDINISGDLPDQIKGFLEEYLQIIRQSYELNEIEKKQQDFKKQLEEFEKDLDLHDILSQTIVYK